eukprot:scaffold273_cov349-Prasinococcus_capsulatus_cf.AAC.8
MCPPGQATGLLAVRVGRGRRLRPPTLAATTTAGSPSPAAGPFRRATPGHGKLISRVYSNSALEPTHQPVDRASFQSVQGGSLPLLRAHKRTHIHARELPSGSQLRRTGYWDVTCGKAPFSSFGRWLDRTAGPPQL